MCDAKAAPRQLAVSGRSHPFAVGLVPRGFRPVSAGSGNKRQAWGDDSFGTDEPFTVLRGDGDSVMVVSTTGFEGYQGNLGSGVGGLGRRQQ